MGGVVTHFGNYRLRLTKPYDDAAWHLEWMNGKFHRIMRVTEKEWWNMDATVLVYLDGGDNCLHTCSDREEEEWKRFGAARGQKYMYVGWRHQPFPTGRIGKGEPESVIVFDKVEWSDEEKKRRESNDFHITKSVKL